MGLNQIIIIACVLVLLRTIHWNFIKKWSLFLLSVVSIYWFQIPLSIRSLSFWLPTLTLSIALISWLILAKRENPLNKFDCITIIVTILIPLIFPIMRAFGIYEIFFIQNSPNISSVLIYLFVIALFIAAINIKKQYSIFELAALIAILLFFFLILKNQNLLVTSSKIIRHLSGQSVKLASTNDLVWVGYSYFAFRLFHVIFDRKRLNVYQIPLRDFITYLIFFPSYTAGPIDRIDHFNKELAKDNKDFIQEDFLEGGLRILRGMFFKFILADSLSLFALNTETAQIVHKPIWLWIVIYAYSFRIFFDFSGYTDIAIGISKLVGINLPENFNHPYRSKNVTIFWNNWHITLTQWFRTYYFNPLTRFIRTRFIKISPFIVIFAMQTSTMVLIGLWHGISLNFVIWGIWNGLGLFIHNRWSEIIKNKTNAPQNERFLKLRSIAGTIMTFNFISLGWVWFALPDINQSIIVFSKLF